MELIDIITLALSAINSLSVIVIGVQTARREKKEKIKSKKKIWYKTEVISNDKINKHVQAIEQVLNEESDKLTMCQKLNSCMLDFFYSSINYIAFFNMKYCEQIKKEIMAAMDSVICAVVYSENKMSDRDKEKALKIYRIKIMALFYNLDLQL
ncbi:MAG: hypothetical protein K2M47_05375 [Clostridiales bacterium]|nr:hypothetical protein [Clostridiales bacterium]